LHLHQEGLDVVTENNTANDTNPAEIHVAATHSERRRRSSRVARSLTAIILGAFVVAAIGEGIACAFLWDRLSQARTDLVAQAASTKIANTEPADDDSSRIQARKADAGEGEPSQGKAGDALAMDETSFHENQLYRFEVESEIARMQTEQQEYAAENIRLKQRLGFLTQRLDSIVFQREQLAAAKRELERRLEEATVVRTSKPEATDQSQSAGSGTDRSISNAAISNAAISNAAISNAVISNAAISNAANSNAATYELTGHTVAAKNARLGRIQDDGFRAVSKEVLTRSVSEGELP